jgi:hypothetical protein
LKPSVTLRLDEVDSLASIVSHINIVLISVWRMPEKQILLTSCCHGKRIWHV